MNKVIGLSVLLAMGCSDQGTGFGAEDGTEVGSEVETGTQALSNKDFDVQFNDCDVFAGLAHVSGERARALVPSQYTLLLDGGQARMVVRVVHCSSVEVDGKAMGSTIVSHIGIGLVGPDPSVNLNNYTLWYATDNARLHARLTAAGVNADKSNFLSVNLSGGALAVASSSPHTPSFSVNGTAELPTGAAVPTSASWWDDGSFGPVRSRTALPAIQFGVAHTVLTTPSGSELATLIGGTTLNFDILDSYNLFASGPMEVRSTP